MVALVVFEADRRAEGKDQVNMGVNSGECGSGGCAGDSGNDCGACDDGVLVVGSDGDGYGEDGEGVNDGLGAGSDGNNGMKYGWW